MPRHVVIARDALIAEEGAARRLPEGVPVERYHVRDLDLDRIFDQLATSDLFATARALHYVDFLALKLAAKKDAERLAGIFDRMPGEITLVCSQVLDFATRGEEQRALKGQTWQRWTTGAEVDDLRQLSEGERAVDWLRRRARDSYGLALDSRQAAALLAANDGKLALVDTELRKLWMLKPADDLTPVSDATLEAALSSNPGARFYQLVDALLSGAADTQERLRQWYALEPDTYRLLTVLTRRLLDVLALSRGEEPGPPFMLRQLRTLARRWPPRRLARALGALARVEHELKSGLIPGETARQAELSALQLLAAELAEAG